MRVAERIAKQFVASVSPLFIVPEGNGGRFSCPFFHFCSCSRRRQRSRAFVEEIARQLEPAPSWGDVCREAQVTLN